MESLISIAHDVACTVLAPNRVADLKEPLCPVPDVSVLSSPILHPLDRFKKGSTDSIGSDLCFVRRLCTCVTRMAGTFRFTSISQVSSSSRDWQED
jgi:hypothetical protein